MDWTNRGTPVVVVPGFPFPTSLRENPLVTAIAATPTRIFQNNPDRVFFYAENVGSSPSRLGFDREISATRGRLLDSNGGWASAQLDEDGDAVSREVFAIGYLGATTYYTIEIFRVSADGDR